MKDKAPERIWAYTNDGYGDRMTDHGTWDTGIEGQPDCHPEWPHAPYIRADLTPSPAPDVRVTDAMVERAAVALEETNNWETEAHIKLAGKAAAMIRAQAAKLDAADAERDALRKALRGALDEILTLYEWSDQVGLYDIEGTTAVIDARAALQEDNQ